MKGDNKVHWNWFLKQAKKDLALEEVRDEDDNLIKLLKQNIEEAEARIKEIEDGV